MPPFQGVLLASVHIAPVPTVTKPSGQEDEAAVTVDVDDMDVVWADVVGEVVDVVVVVVVVA